MENKEPKDPAILAKIRELLAKRGAPISVDVNSMANADTVEPPPPQPPTPMAEGGVAEKKDSVPLHTGVQKEPAPELPPVAKAINVALNKTTGFGMSEPNPSDPNNVAKGLFMQKRFAHGGVATPNDNAPTNAPVGPSDAEKRECVDKALREKTLKLDDGGVVDQSELPMPVDAPQESKLDAIMKAIGMAGKQAAAPLGLVGAPAKALASGAADVARTPGVAPAVNAVLGTHLQDPEPSAAITPPVPTPEVPPAPPMAPAPKVAPAGVSGPAPVDPMAQLGKADVSIPGLAPADRQALATQVGGNQHTFGNYLAEAVAGLGDAISAKGGVQQNALGNIFALQTQQRQEALDNFDKARQAAVEHFTMKNQADQALINNLKARGELQVAPSIAQALGHPELANRPVAQAELILKTDAMKYDYANKMQERKQSALKNAAEEADKAIAHGGMFGTQKMMDPNSRLTFIHSQAIKNDPEAFGYHISQGK